MGNLAIITARGGSKRIPKKNIKEFCGKPIIVYSIQAAIKAEIFDEIMVSTDNADIADIAVNAGAKVPFMRSKENSNDYATTVDVLKEVIGGYSKQNVNFTYACCIYPTAPFITPQKLKLGMDLLKNKDVDTVVPVVEYSYPPQRGLKIRKNRLISIYDEFINSRSQDLEKMYHDCGQFYCFRIKSFLKTNKLIGKSTVPIVIEELESQDIDTITDWNLAEIKYKFMMEKNKREN